MRTTTPLRRVLLSALLFSVAAASVAQGPPGQDPNNLPPGHGGVPPGQAKKQGNGGVPPGQAKKYEGDIPPGQAKKWLREDDRSRYYSHYRKDADHWKGRKRPAFVVGLPIPIGYMVQPMPRSYWVGAPPPPPGYQYGYCGGYAVVYNPTTRVIADVMDLIGAATGH